MAKTALIFPGQGAQFVGMGRELAEHYPQCAELFERASGVLGYDVAQLCFDGPIEALTRTDRCQPAIFVVSAACATALRSVCPSVDPLAVAGLSLGEWTALYYAGVMDFEDAVRILDLRGRAMQSACDIVEGSMVSVLGLSMEALAPITALAGVEISNINAPGQVVLSGAAAPVAAAAEAARQAGARKVIPLKVAGAYHSSLMASAADELSAFLQTISFRNPLIKVLSNADGEPHAGPDAIKQAMVKQVVGTVRWLDNTRWMLDAGVTTFIECGPGKVLSTIIKRLDSSAMVANIQDRASLETALTVLTGL